MMKQTVLAVSFVGLACAALAAATVQDIRAEVGETAQLANEHYAARRFEKAVGDYTRLLALVGDKASVYQRRGEAYFRLGKVKESLADFDKVIELQPGEAAHHWQRGIALYYAGEFRRGAEQFEQHREVNPQDVENAAWHYLCVARASGVKKARASLIPIDDDRRVPMMKVHAMFAGNATPAEVIAAAEAVPERADGAERKLALFYAHLYLGLYHEAQGDAAAAKEHILLAAEKYAGDDYMGDVARVHAAVLKRSAKEAGARAQPPVPAPEPEPETNTFSIVAYDPEKKEWAVGVASKVLGVGTIVPWAKAGVGAIATQSYANITYGPRGLELLAQGKSAQETIDLLTKDDEGRARRQVGVVDAQGNAAHFTGEGCHAWAGHKSGKHYTCQGNLLAGPGGRRRHGRRVREGNGAAHVARHGGAGGGGERRRRQARQAVGGDPRREGQGGVQRGHRPDGRPPRRRPRRAGEGTGADRGVARETAAIAGRAARASKPQGVPLHRPITPSEHRGMGCQPMSSVNRAKDDTRFRM
jgi:lipoprotein NlpI